MGDMGPSPLLFSCYFSLPYECRGLDNFKLGSRIYKGACSEVFKATDLRSGARVAVKAYRKKNMDALVR